MAVESRDTRYCHRVGRVLGFALVGALGTACGDRAPDAPATQTAPPVVVEPTKSVPRAAPHGAAIRLIAVTDAGDAALTIDALDAIRLWPTLDGTREPVVLHGPVARGLALGRTPDGFVAGVLDEVGGLEIQQLDREGVLRTRTRLAAEPAIAQVLAISGALLVRRTDHAVLRVDPAGHVTATLVAPPGTRLLDLATRHGIVLAAIAEPVAAVDGSLPHTRELRRIELAGLAWGASTILPIALATPLAVSPSGQRVAGRDPKHGGGIVIDLVPAPIVVETKRDVAVHALGFLDETHVALPVPAVSRIAPFPLRRQPAPLAPIPLGRAQAPIIEPVIAAVADDRVISSDETSLVISDPYRAQYLGYRDQGVGELEVVPGGTIYEYDVRIWWLDGGLHAKHMWENTAGEAGHASALDDRYVLRDVHHYPEPPRRPGPSQQLFLVDTQTDKQTELGTWPGYSVAYEPRTRTIAIVDQHEIHRIRLDPSNAVIPLRRLFARELTKVKLFDPAVANGTCAILSTITNEGFLIESITDAGPATGAPLAVGSTIPATKETWPIAQDRTGRVYFKGADNTIVVYNAGKLERTIVLPELAAGFGEVDSLGVSGSGDLALFDPGQVVVVDAQGKERWRTPMWHTKSTRFSADDRTVIVNTEGGVVALDAKSGAKRATGCAWGFGLHVQRPRSSRFDASVVCAE